MRSNIVSRLPMSILSSTFRIVSGGDVASGLAAAIALPAAKTDRPVAGGNGWRRNRPR
jgi:hypothetical protein